MAVDYDLILESLGECGPWQIWMFCLLALPSAFSAMAVYMYEFTAFEPKHRCFVDGCDTDGSSYTEKYLNFTVPWEDEGPSECKVFERVNSDLCRQEDFIRSSKECDRWVYDTSFLKSSAVKDFGMVCKDEWKKSLAQTLYMAGMTLGSLLFGWMGDRFGRKATLLLNSLILVIGGCLPIFFNMTPDLYFILCISRLLSGLGHAGSFMMTFSLALEYVGPKFRVLFGIIIETPFASGGLLVGLVSYLGVREWKTLSLVLSLPNIIVLTYWWLLPESPRWLIATGRLDQLQTDVNKVAKVNKKNPIKVYDFDNQVKAEQKSASFRDLLRPRPILVRSVVMFFNWAVTNMCFYGLTSTVSVLLEDIYLNYTLVILVEIPSHFFCAFLLPRWGRRGLLGFSQLLAGLTCIAAGLLYQDSMRIPQVVLALFGKFGASCSFAIVFVYTAELFPTEIRNRAVGASSTCARLAGILAPQIAALSTFWSPLPLLILGGGAAIGGVLVFLMLPETLGERLPETMEDAINLGAKKKTLK